MKNTRTDSGIIVAYILFGLPFLYYAYKYGTPEFGGSDVYSYFRLYANWDFASVDSPFNQRLISSFCIYLLHLSGLSYPTKTAIELSGMDPQVYFCALFFNYLCVVATCYVLFRMVREHLKSSTIFAFTTGLTFYLGFGTLLFLISGLSDALSVLMIAMIFNLYLKKSSWQYPLLIAAVFQREYVFFVFGLVAFIHWFSDKANRRYYATVVAANVLCFLLYILMRKTLFFTPRYEHQMAVTSFMEKVQYSIQDYGAYIRQTFIMQNILLLYTGIFVYKKVKGMTVNTVNVVIVYALLAEIVILSLFIGLGNNTGRYYYMSVPLLIYFMALEALPLFRANNADHETGSVRS